MRSTSNWWSVMYFTARRDAEGMSVFGPKLPCDQSYPMSDIEPN